MREARALALAAAVAVALLPAGGRTQPSVSKGAALYAKTCAACHQASGAGLPERYPPLAGSEVSTGDEGRVIRIVLQGLIGPVEVQGETYTGAMPGWGTSLDDAEIAAVLTYVRGAWGNRAAAVTRERVAEVRAATAARSAPWTMAELDR